MGTESRLRLAMYSCRFPIRGRRTRSSTIWSSCWWFRSCAVLSGPTLCRNRGLGEREAGVVAAVSETRAGHSLPRHLWPVVRGDRSGRISGRPSSLGRSGVARLGERRRGGHRRQDQSSVGKGGRHPPSPGQRLCGPSGCGAGQRATAEKSNEKTAIPALLATLALEGSIVTIDAMGTQPNIAQAIRDRGADYVLAVKDNQPTLADSIGTSSSQFEACT